MPTDQTFQQSEKVAGKKRKPARRGWNDFLDNALGKDTREGAAEEVSGKPKAPKK